MTHYHGSFGHDHPGGDAPHDHPPAPEPPPRGNGGWLGAACVLAVIGAVVFFLLGRDYAGCQSVLVQSDPANDSACGTAQRAAADNPQTEDDIDAEYDATVAMSDAIKKSQDPAFQVDAGQLSGDLQADYPGSATISPWSSRTAR